MARYKTVNLTLSQQILEILIHDITHNGLLNVALIIKVLGFYQYHCDDFIAEFEERDYVEWSQFASWMRMHDFMNTI